MEVSSLNYPKWKYENNKREWINTYMRITEINGTLQKDEMLLNRPIQFESYRKKFCIDTYDNIPLQPSKTTLKDAYSFLKETPKNFTKGKQYYTNWAYCNMLSYLVEQNPCYFFNKVPIKGNWQVFKFLHQCMPVLQFKGTIPITLYYFVQEYMLDETQVISLLKVIK